MTKAMNSGEFGKELGDPGNEIQWTQESKLPERYKRFLEEAVILLITHSCIAQCGAAWLHVKGECGTRAVNGEVGTYAAAITHPTLPLNILNESVMEVSIVGHGRIASDQFKI